MVSSQQRNFIFRSRTNECRRDTPGGRQLGKTWKMTYLFIYLIYLCSRILCTNTRDLFSPSLSVVRLIMLVILEGNEGVLSFDYH